MHLSLRIPRACIDSLFLIYTAVRVDSAEDLFIIYQNPTKWGSFSESPCLPIWTRATRTPTPTSTGYIISPVSIAGGPGGIWTPDPDIMSVSLSPLSYRSELPAFDYFQGVANPYTWSFLFYGREKNRTSAFASSNSARNIFFVLLLIYKIIIL